MAGRGSVHISQQRVRLALSVHQCSGSRSGSGFFMFLDLLDPHPDTQFICTNPDPALAPDPNTSINEQKNEEKP